MRNQESRRAGFPAQPSPPGPPEGAQPSPPGPPEGARQGQDAGRWKDEHLALLAHELRNPLAAILFSLEALQLAPPGTPSFSEAQRVMRRKVQYMARVLDDLLDVSRFNRDKIEFHKEPLQLQTVMSRAVKGLQPLLEEKTQRLETSLPAEPIWVAPSSESS